MVDEGGIHVEIVAGPDFVPSERLRAALAGLSDALAGDELLDPDDVSGFAMPGASGGLPSLRIGGLHAPMPKQAGSDGSGTSGCIGYCFSDADCILCSINWT
jgi:hypothetical protein